MCISFLSFKLLSTISKLGYLSVHYPGRQGNFFEMQPKLRIIWKENDFDEERETFDFCEEFGESNQPLFCGKFCQPVPVDDGTVFETVHFTSFNLGSGFIILNSEILSWSFRLSKYENLSFEIITPGIIQILLLSIFILYLVPEPQPLRLNKLNLTGNDKIFAHVFFEDSGKKVSFLESIAAKYGEMKQVLENIMNDNGIVPDCFIMFKSEGTYSNPKPFSNFFEKRINIKQFSKFSIIILTMEVDGKRIYS